MTENIVLIENIQDLKIIPESILENKKIITFDLEVNELLKNKKISCQKSDDFISNMISDMKSVDLAVTFSNRDLNAISCALSSGDVFHNLSDN